MDFAVVDIVLVSVLLISIVIGAWRGLLYEVLSVFGWVAAFFLAQWFAVDVASWLPLGTDTPEPLRYAAGFALVFVAVAFAAGLLAWLVKQLVESVGLRPVDRTLGAVFGLLRGLIILLALGLVVAMTPLHQHAQWQASRGAGLLDASLKTLSPLLPAELASHFD